MNTEIKDKLINKIQELEDSEILEEIYSWLEDESVNTPYVTSDAQKNAIKEGIQQIHRGQVIPSKKADQEIDQWFGSID